MKNYFHIVVLFFTFHPFSLLSQQATPSFRKTTTSAMTRANKFVTHSNNTSTPKVIFWGSTALSGQGTDVTKTITASGQLMTSANIIRGLNISLGANLINVNPGKTKKDSVDFNSLMFPETGNFGFLLHPSYNLTLKGISNDKNEYSIIPFYEFAYRKFSIDSPQLAFKIYNHTVGLGMEWNYHPDEENDFTLNTSVYYHWFKVPYEDAKKFTSFINDSLFEKAVVKKEAVLIQSLGVKITAQYNSFTFFADFRKNFKTHQLSENNPFRGTMVNIGFQTFLKIKSF